jgi:hypothetical protein
MKGGLRKMKKIGFIDHYIDNWHSGNYPQFIKDSSLGDKFEVTLAWTEVEREGTLNIDQWCEKHQIAKASSIEQVVEESDCIVVLSPNNPERHEFLTDLPLRCGKPVYVDKTFAPSLAAAKRMLGKAKAHNTPMMTSSALRFDSTITDAAQTIADQPVHFVSTRGGGLFEIYAIHQIEMLATLMGTGANRLMQCGNGKSKLMVIDYDGGRRGVINLIPGLGFQFNAQFGDEGLVVANDMTDFFPCFIEAMLAFFQTGESLVPIEQTLEVAAILEAGNQALRTPDQWVEIPK